MEGSGGWYVALLIDTFAQKIQKKVNSPVPKKDIRCAQEKRMSDSWYTYIMERR